MRGPNTAKNVNDKYNVNKNAFPKDGSTVVAKLCVVFHAANIKKNATYALDSGCNLVLHCNGNIKEMIKLSKNIFE